MVDLGEALETKRISSLFSYGLSGVSQYEQVSYDCPEKPPLASEAIQRRSLTMPSQSLNFTGYLTDR